MLRYLPLLCYLLTACGPATPPPEDRPNILFLFTDDQTYTALGALGNAEIITPNLDRLVREGTTFTHAYNMGGWQPAVCLASRHMLNSGRSVWRAQELHDRWQRGDTTGTQELWGNRMAAAGYNTFFSGKWHVRLPAEAAFGTVEHVRPGMPNDNFPFPAMTALMERHGGAPPRDSVIALYPPGYNRPLGPEDDSYDPADPKFGGFWAGGRHWSEVLADDGEAFLAAAATDDRPFFMYLAFNAPHDPKQAPRVYLDRYDPAKVSVPASFQPLYPDKEAIGNGTTLRDEALAPFPRTELAVRTHRAEYYALVTHLDAQIGRILEQLEATGQAENTVIIFTSDHGLAVGRHGLLGKQNLYDHSVRVPLVLAGPNIPRGRRIDRDVYLQDVMPTALDLARAQVPATVEFESLLPLVQDPTAGGLDAVYGAYVDLQRSVRKDGYKLLVYPQIPQAKLFHVAEDPEELRDLAAAEPARVAELFGELQGLQARFGDTLRLELSDYQ